MAESLAGAGKQSGGEVNGAQGGGVDIGGYYGLDSEKVAAAMRPSQTFNSILDAI